MNPTTINSTSSVSTTRRKRDAERSVNWTAEETQVLLCAWSDERVQRSLAENLRNTHVFKHLSARMSEMGFSRSPHQCRLRVKTLKANYVRAKLQKSVNGSQPCTFKYFAEMDAVLGRRSAGMEKGLRLISLDGMAESYGRRCIPADFNSKTKVGADYLSALGSTERQSFNCLEQRVSGQLNSEIKLEDREESSNEFEFSDPGISQHEAYTETTIRPESNGTTVETSLSTPSPHVLPPLAAPPVLPPPPPQPTTSHLSGPPDDSSNTLPTSGQNHVVSSCLEPILKHLSECFQQLVSETRSLLVQLEGQRQEHARWHQELLAQWLQREERRQREVAEREERREKARMEHEIRVLELLHSLTTQHGCTRGGSKTQSEDLTGPNHTRNRDAH
ncbi:ras-GEF domain-containing family member 1B-A isoform X2 [Melanotaenia boesemani]|uniref:ras-GEF domain-containing family member 1B-A isoform X2 n=1 Tax=Melanotaenia boesemani TaxID=1250792 RepID=UPI001C05086C|nr:ras-GEF domain-containing family member 1B-A isoform X2 [Melanotaenia boesemani]